MNSTKVLTSLNLSKLLLGEEPLIPWSTYGTFHMIFITMHLLCRRNSVNHFILQIEYFIPRDPSGIVPTCDSRITCLGLRSWMWTTVWKENHNIQTVPLWSICVNAFTTNVKITFSWFLCGPIMYREGNNRKKFRNISITKLLISQSTTFIIIYLFVQAISKYDNAKKELKNRLKHIWNYNSRR